MDSTGKGSSTKQADTWFIDGLHPENFTKAVRAHDTKTVEDTCEPIGDDITVYEGILRVLDITQLKGMFKVAHVPAPAPIKGSPVDDNLRKSRFTCGNCGGDRDERA